MRDFSHTDGINLFPNLPWTLEHHKNRPPSKEPLVTFEHIRKALIQITKIVIDEYKLQKLSAYT